MAAGRPGLVTGEMLSPGVVVVDVGINVVPDGQGGERLVGDVDFESAQGVVSAITPVPGRRRAADERAAADPPAAGGHGPGGAARVAARRAAAAARPSR